MRFYPKLNIYRNSTGTNKFDGHKAYSYNWYCYAEVMSNNKIVMCENSYSNSTAKHMADFAHSPDYRILAPQGLDKLDAARSAIAYEIAKLEKELTNPRNRDIAGRKARIGKLQAMLSVVDMLENDRNGSIAA